MEQIDITMTASKRPGIIKRTLTSFCENLFTDSNNYRLIINLDNVGEDCDCHSIVEICSYFFKNVLFCYSEEPSFPKAVKRVWSLSSSRFVFHLEDDWILNKKIKMEDLVTILKSNPRIANVRLSKYDLGNTKDTSINVFSQNFVYTGMGFFLGTNKGKAFALNPTLINSNFLKKSIPLLDMNKNPEKQFRANNPIFSNFISEWEYALFGTPGEKAIVTDIGREWRKQFGFIKPSINGFIKWENKQ